MPTEQESLIGAHPTTPHIFGDWLQCHDIKSTPAKPNKKHRKLTEIAAQRSSAISAIADWIIQHHVSAKRLKRLQNRKAEIMTKYGISIEEYVDEQNLFPILINTQTGNATEIILSQYLQESSGLEMLAYKLTYNPNVDQSMKGDDCLLFNKANLNEKIIVGEAKYRATPTKAVVEEIVSNLEGSKRLPISLPFISNHLSSLGDEVMASQIDDLQFEVSKGRILIINVGFLLSSKGTNRSTDTALRVEHNLDSSNPNLVLLSLGVDNPFEIIQQAFDLAKTKLLAQI